jgi:hypothetical protein
MKNEFAGDHCWRHNPNTDPRRFCCQANCQVKKAQETILSIMPAIHLVCNGWSDPVPAIGETMTLDELKAKIKAERPGVGVKPYSHNIIRLLLQQIDKEYGLAEANKAIDDFDLIPLGWRHKACPTCGHWPCGCGD